MYKNDKMPFFEIIIFGILYCLNYRKEHNDPKKDLSVPDVRESMKKLMGNDVSLQDIENAIETLIANGLIDTKLAIQDETIESSLIEFNVKQNASDNISRNYANRKRLILSVVKVLAHNKGSLSELTIKGIQNELKRVSGVTVKQSEIKTVIDSLPEELDLTDKSWNSNEELETIQNLVDLESVAAIQIWSVVTFGVICCLRRTPDYCVKKKVLEESIVLHKIEELVEGSVKSIHGFTFKGIKDELILNKLINHTLNVIVKDTSKGKIIINPRILLGPSVATLDFVSLIAFYALYVIGRKPKSMDEILKQMKKTAGEYSLNLKNIDEKSIPFIISFLYTQGIINDKYEITISDFRRWQFLINDMKMMKSDNGSSKSAEEVRTKELIKQQCLTKMGCNGGDIVEVGDETDLYVPMAKGMSIKMHHPFTKPAFAKLNFVSLLALHALYTLNKELPYDKKPGYNAIAEQMERTAGEYSFDLKNIDRRNVPYIISYLYAQGIINDKRKIKIPDLRNFHISVNDIDMIESEKTLPKEMAEIITKKQLVQKCLTEMGCDVESVDETEKEPDPGSDYTYYDDAGNIFHRFNSDEIENHECILMDCLNDKDYLEKIIGKNGEPLIPIFHDKDPVMAEIRTGQEFLWECYNARTNEEHKDFYRRLIFFASKFIYENTLFLESLLGITEPADISERLGINVSSAEILRRESEETDAIMELAHQDLNNKVNEYLVNRINWNYMGDDYKNMSKEDKINDLIEDNRPLIQQVEGISETRRFIGLVRRIDNYNVSRETDLILESFKLGDEDEDFMPFVVEFRKTPSLVFSLPKTEKKKIKDENQNRKRALYVLLYSLYQFMKGH